MAARRPPQEEWFVGWRLLPATFAAEPAACLNQGFR
jgi:hypothetical protein